MKCLIRLLGILLLISISFACKKKQNGSVIFYVTNAGDKNLSDQISIEIEDKVAYFFTKEATNMQLTDCTKASENTARFCLQEGVYHYYALGEKGQWKGSITIKEGECKIVPLTY